MTDHDHSERVEGCFRCELSADEATPQPRDEPTKRVGRDCQMDGCSFTVDDGVLWRVNPKGERGVFMCEEHARDYAEAHHG